MRKLIATLLTSVLTTATVSAQVPTADADLDLIVKVKSALGANPEVKKLPLTVSVLDGVAVIGGAVPTATTGDLLAACVKAVPGLKEVRVNCWVPTNEDPLTAAVNEKLKSTVATALPPTTITPPLVPVTPAPRPEPVGVTTAAKPSNGYSPVPPPAPPAPFGPSQYPTIPSPKVPVKPGQDVAAAVDAVKQLDRRYSGLKMSVNVGTVTIAGDNADAAWDLAAEVRKVPGVEKVIVGRGR
ncbi:hypothetical protein BH11PLA2_BH11PLA2_12680 [soil metagenome]